MKQDHKHVNSAEFRNFCYNYYAINRSSLKGFIIIF